MNEGELSLSPPRTGRRWLMAAVKLLVVGLVIWGIHGSVQSALEKLRQQAWSVADLRPGWIVAAALLYLLGLLPNGLFWHRLLRTLGQQPRWCETLRAYYIGHLGKYVPGKALVVVLRAGLVRSPRVDTTAAAVAVFFETLNMIAVGAFVAGAILAVAYRHQSLLLLVSLGMMLVAGLPTWPPIFRRLAMLARVGRISPGMVEKLAHLRFGTQAYGWVCGAASWVLIGLSLWCTVLAGGAATWPGSLGQIALCVAAASLAVVVGFASLVPGGAFIREAILFELLQPAFGEAGALVAAVLARLVWLGAEVAISALWYGWGGPTADARLDAVG